MSKHTPGPWRVGDSHLEITDADGHRAIAEVRDHDGWEEISEEEQEANLRLIAAAPDLLEALKPFADVDEVELIGAPNDMPIEEALCKAGQPTVGDLLRAMDAIEKAEGKE